MRVGREGVRGMCEMNECMFEGLVFFFKRYFFIYFFYFVFVWHLPFDSHMPCYNDGCCDVFFGWREWRKPLIGLACVICFGFGKNEKFE